MKGFIKEKIDLVGNLTGAEAREKWDAEVEAHKNRREEKLVGEAIYKLSGEGTKILVKYYHCYKKDMCDTVFEGELLSYNEDASSITGFIKKPKSIVYFAFGWLLLGLIISALVFLWFVDVLPTLATLAVVLGVFALCFKIDNSRKDSMVSYLEKFTNGAAKPANKSEEDENEGN